MLKSHKQKKEKKKKPEKQKTILTYYNINPKALQYYINKPNCFCGLKFDYVAIEDKLPKPFPIQFDK